VITSALTDGICLSKIWYDKRPQQTHKQHNDYSFHFQPSGLVMSYE
jgi:hypothetical protein